LLCGKLFSRLKNVIIYIHCGAHASDVIASNRAGQHRYWIIGEEFPGRVGQDFHPV
jgi:hypothetical protein